MPRKTIIQDLVRGRIQNLTRLCFKIVCEESKRKFFFCSRVIQFDKSSIAFITILNCLDRQKLTLQTDFHGAIVKEKQRYKVCGKV